MPRPDPVVPLAPCGLLSVLLALAAPACGGPEPRPEEGPDLERFTWFRALPGRWVATEDSSAPGMEVAYRLTAGGHVVEETIAPGTEHEMVTMIHPGAGGLALTHYCALGNQPRMRALAGGAEAREVDFHCEESPGGNEDDMHMHRVVYAFPGDGRVRSTWSLFEAGELVEVKRFDLVRLPPRSSLAAEAEASR